MKMSLRTKKKSNQPFNETESKEIAKTIARYGSSNLFYQIIGIGNAILKPKLLTPELLGVWSLLNLFLRFTPYLHLGSRASMRYQIPKKISDGREAECKEIMGAVYYGTLAISLVVSLILAFFAIFLKIENTIRFGLLTVAIVVITLWFSAYQVCLLKANQKFTLLSKANYIEATILSVTNIVCILLFGIYGLYFSIIFTNMIIIIYINKKFTIPRHGKYNHDVFVSLVREGFPIMIYNAGGALVASSDKLIISTMLGIKQLGYYGIATMILNFLMQVPGASREVVESKLIESFENDREQAVAQYLVQPLMITAYLMPFFIGSGVFILPDAVAFLLPNYLPSVKAAQIILLGGFPLALSYVLRGGIVACNIQAAASMMMAASASFNFLFSWILVKNGFGIEGVAFSSACSFALLFFLLQLLLAKKIATWNKNKISLYISIPFLITIFFCFAEKTALNYFFNSNIYINMINILFFCFIMMLVYNAAARFTGEFRPLSFSYWR